MYSFKAIKKDSLSQRIEKDIKNAIASRIYKPLEKLPSERDLMGQFNVSRTTIREALMSLQSSGLIFVKRGMNAGAYVAEINPDPITENFQNLIKFGKINFVHLTEARLYIEPEAARIAAICRSEKDLATLNELLAKAEASNQTSVKEARLINVRFHVEVAKVTQNPIIIFISESVTQVFSAGLIERTKLSKADVLKNIDAHRYILDSIIRKDEKEAYERAKSHILGVYHTYRRIIPNVPRSDIRGLENRLGDFKKDGKGKSRVTFRG
ncbi:MAG: FadR family transcriptional regulator [Syntrophaceae bacterium]|nr:FadR family transcriptional regulator [Syntrophaceae bacterium]